MALLFEPERIERRLSVLPALAAQLPSPREEGEPAAAESAETRKTGRALYRLLANADMPHLRAALLALEHVTAAKIDLGDLLTTTRPDQFSARLSEALVADHFLLKDFQVRSIPRGNGRTADFVVEDGELAATVEVYSPREWEAIADWETALWDTVKNLDVRQLYRASVNTCAEPLSDPWTVARWLRHTGADVLARIEADLLELFAGSGTTLKQAYQHEPYPIETELDVEVLAQHGGYHDRFIFHGNVRLKSARKLLPAPPVQPQASPPGMVSRKALDAPAAEFDHGDGCALGPGRPKRHLAAEGAARMLQASPLSPIWG